ncbi:MAG: 30S ribosomal protein S16 [Pirellulaceae bacterium]|nr:30S ribosomal protein S16 [Pirellulaceae bacterium]
MSVKIRLKKLGRKHRPFFRVCAMDTRTRRDGREIEVLGVYDPMVPETDARAVLNGARIDYWLGVGATPSPKVGTLIKKYGTNGSHLEEQKLALDRLGGRRASSIAAAVNEANETKVELKPDAPEETPEAAAEATAPEAETKTPEAAAETPAVAEAEKSSSSDAGDATPADDAAEAKTDE